MIHILILAVGLGLVGEQVRADFDGVQYHLAYLRPGAGPCCYAVGPPWHEECLGAADFRFAPAVHGNPLIVAWTEPSAGAILVWDGTQTRRIHETSDGTSNRPDTDGISVVSQRGYGIAANGLEVYHHEPDEPQWPAISQGRVAFSTFKPCGPAGGVGLLTSPAPPVCVLGWSGYTAGLDLDWPHLAWIEWYGPPPHPDGSYRRVGYANLETGEQRDLSTEVLWTAEWPPQPQIAGAPDGSYLACWHGSSWTVRCSDGRTMPGRDPAPVWNGERFVVFWSYNGEVMASERLEARPTPVPTATATATPAPTSAVPTATPTPVPGSDGSRDLWQLILALLRLIFGGGD